jgi:23S rRNA (adenine2503-C2)-methyltransferase
MLKRTLLTYSFQKAEGKNNLIPINKIKDGVYEKSSTEKILAFRDYLNEKGIVATVRRELGSDISAACGQLVRQSKEENS